MNLEKALNAGSFLKQWLQAVRNDAAAMDEVRKLVLGLVIGIFVWYSASLVFLGPIKKTIKNNISDTLQIDKAAPAEVNDMLKKTVADMEKENNELKEQIAVLKLKEDLQREQWRMLADSGQFVRILFTMLPSAPISIENFEEDLERMNFGEPVSKDSFQVHPVTITGDTDFTTLCSYLQYIEGRREISVMNSLTIEALPVKDDQLQSKIHFSLQAGRMDLSKDS